MYSAGGQQSKKLLADAHQMLEDAKAKIDYIKMRINKLNQNVAQSSVGESRSMGNCAPRGGADDLGRLGGGGGPRNQQRASEEVYIFIPLLG